MATQRTRTYSVNVAKVKRQLPTSIPLPAGFEAFAAWCTQQPTGSVGWFRIEGRDPRDLFPGMPREQIIPFLVLPDGGVVAWWLTSTRTPPIVWLGSEGEHAVVATSIPDFLARLAARTTSIPDLDDQASTAPATWKKKPASLTALKKAWRAFVKKHTPKGENVTPEVAEAVRKAVVAACRPRLRKAWDHVQVVVTSTPKTYDVGWYIAGLQPFPADKAAKLRAPLERLRDALGRSLQKSSLDVWGDGRVFFEKNTQWDPPAR